MASSQSGLCSRVTARAAVVPSSTGIHHSHSLIQTTKLLMTRRRGESLKLRVRVSSSNNGGEEGEPNSYLGMWKNAVNRERKAIEFEKIIENTADDVRNEEAEEESLEKKTSEFQKILQVPREERDRVQRMQVIDRAAAAIAAARVLIEDNPTPNLSSKDFDVSNFAASSDFGDHFQGQGKLNFLLSSGLGSGMSFLSKTEISKNGTPGPDFWSWTPPEDNGSSPNDGDNFQAAEKTLPSPSRIDPVMEKEQKLDSLLLPFESKLLEGNHNPLLPPLQSLIEVEKLENSNMSSQMPFLEEERAHDALFSAQAAEAAHALEKVDEASSHGVYPDGSRWWKETGVEQQPDGVVCKWTLKRGVSADRSVEWEDKFWEAADELGYKELGSEKSGRDAVGNVWHEYWKESMWQIIRPFAHGVLITFMRMVCLVLPAVVRCSTLTLRAIRDHGLLHFEKTADKWGMNGKGDEWQEKWWEKYDASGQTEKWAHKWCSIDPNAPLEAGHAHVWHERWGEKYDGKGGSIKYTDKWAERHEDGGWTKWGDKWDENFDLNGHGVKQGETWWHGKYGERWNRTWGEHHNGSGWLHKYGKSSSGEHWDTHVQEETWYERFPHFGFYHCFENSVRLREVKKPSDA
ncbi:hypothetical protein RJ641_021306 [Dillenia turbinata]|uniref:Uncharacterized protein n=1 Tax=Dillenia turbinata TaxID=194707 RepID=A0AAN8UEI5_9MAGN